MKDYMVVFRSYWPMVFREPGLFDATVHGPATSGRSLDYPWPSTISGALASLHLNTVTLSTCGDRGSVFWDIDCVLSKALGGNYRVYTGYMVDEKEMIYAYTGQGFMSVEEIVEKLEWVKGENGCDPRCIMELMHGNIKPAKISRIGIALNRSAKSAREGYLYSLEYVDYRGEMHIMAYVKSDKNPLPASKTVVHFGGERRYAIAEVREKHINVEGDYGSDILAALLISPALLEGHSLDDGTTLWTEAVDITVESAERLAQLIIDKSGISHMVKPVEPYIITLSKRPIEAANVGWNMAESRLRDPLLLIPPGTILCLKAKNDPKTVAKNIQKNGLGAYTKLGWGTTIVV